MNVPLIKDDSMNSSHSMNSSVIESNKGSVIESNKSSVFEVSMYNGRRQDSVLDTGNTDVKRINDAILWDLIYEDRVIMLFFKIIGFHWYH